METTRLSQLLAFLEEEPNDPFNIYAVAVEYLEKQPHTAISYFEKLLGMHPNYVPTYYQVAGLYESMGELQKARRAYEKGIEVSAAEKDHKANGELKTAYQNFLFEYEDELEDE